MVLDGSLLNHGEGVRKTKKLKKPRCKRQEPAPLLSMVMAIASTLD